MLTSYVLCLSQYNIKQGVIKGQLWEGIVKLFQEVGSQQQPNNEQITITGEDGETAAIVPVR